MRYAIVILVGISLFFTSFVYAVDMNDLNGLIDYLLSGGLGEPVSPANQRFDLNGDGFITMADLTTLIDIVLSDGGSDPYGKIR